MTVCTSMDVRLRRISDKSIESKTIWKTKSERDSSSEDDTLAERRTVGKCSLKRVVASSIDARKDFGSYFCAAKLILMISNINLISAWLGRRLNQVPCRWC